MSCLGWPNYLESPAGKFRLNFRPGMEQTGKSLLRMDTPEREDDTFSRGPYRRFPRQAGQVDPVRDHGDGIGQAEIADLFIFLLARSVDAVRTAESRPLGERPKQMLLQ